MPLLQIFIINRNGGLVFNRKLNENAPNRNVNDMMVLGSTFHSLYEIVKQISPVTSSGGIEKIETAAFKLQCFQTLTGVKFVVTATPENRDEELEGMYTPPSALPTLHSCHRPPSHLLPCSKLY